MKKYAIVCGSRSGSTYLCDLLSSTNRCGKPQEFCNPDMGYGKDRHKWIREYTTENDVFGIKVVGIRQWANFRVSSQLVVNRCIYLYREDAILQAISRYIAFTTNGWHRKTERPEFSYEGIKWCLDEVIEENQFFGRMASKFNWLTISYEEDLCKYPEQTVVSILSDLNISLDDLPAIKPSEDYKKENNEDWKRKFIGFYNEETRKARTSS
jgi:LPS sulfotransferase NodH